MSLGWGGMSRIDDAMRTVAREAFFPEKQKGSAGFDIALPIGDGSTCSQPNWHPAGSWSARSTG